jgi:aldehyde dehydrogenase (NAD+)
MPVRRFPASRHRQDRLHRLDGGGRKILHAAASTMKRVTVELGGKSPNIVFADADLDKAVPAAAMAVFANAGQICSAGTRLFVQRSIHDEFMARLADYTRSIRVGDPRRTQIGPVVSGPQMEKILGFIEGAGEEGARALVGGARMARAGWRRVLHRADHLYRRHRRHDHRARGNLRPGAQCLCL